MAKRALIVVDLQNDYFRDGKFPLIGIEAAARNAARVLAAARAAGDLVVHIRHEFASAGAPFFEPGSAGAQIHESVLNEQGETVIVKNHINSFRETGLKAALERAGVEEIVIIGAMSHMCVDAVTRAANDFGYKVTVVHDACATRDLEFNGVRVEAAKVHAAFMAALGFAYAATPSTDAYLAAAASEKTAA
ncbi:isochorismatase hydrolase [Methylocella silvestris BL2]|uniref:Isochorismatase hydrolase n=1 Tax=Methylocella silvestris (strain DSM 15510 / CIP 108128 / LMG 27833 / NCIMB 13906 / BL2) TaxID=395965 RepID=B8ENS6_METSB|nr:cysteine hydrolase family protein [Methylocella silvestris]ACK50862.1 isochorismatase hydrolase [Methylocella silvestris BL2]